MRPRQVEGAAALLVDARRGGQPLRRLPPELAPATVNAAYAIQDAVIDALGGAGGWKVGAKSPTDEPSCAPIPAALVFASPKEFGPGELRLRGIEAEIAFRIGRDLPPRARAYAIDDVASAVASIHAAIEVVESRFEDFRATEPLAVLADSNSNGALVVASPVAAATRIDQMRQSVRLHFGADRIADVVGGNPAGDLWRLLAWLANHCAARCGGLRKDAIVTTGSCTGMAFAAPGTRVVAELDGLGLVEVLVR
jgi:2-keto-4-pentenoate hydratase